MDCRKWLFVALSLSIAGAGCAWNQNNTRPFSAADTTQTQSTFPGGSLPTVASTSRDEAKKMPKASTCVKGGQLLLMQAKIDDLPRKLVEDRLEGARKAFQQAIKTDPNCVDGYIGVARVYVEYEDFDRALHTYETAVAKFPKNQSVWHDYAQCHGRRKDFKAAAACCQKALDLDPENRAMATQLGLYLARAGEIQQSLAVLTQVHGEARAHVLIARMMEHMQDDQKSQYHLQVALRTDPRLAGSDAVKDLLRQPLGVPPSLSNEPAIANIGFEQPVMQSADSFLQPAVHQKVIP
jgi:tetratricopeptide (TPR) repeat protein